MKTAADPRHIKRIKIIQELFASSFRTSYFTFSDSFKLMQTYFPKIDKLIEKAAPQFPLEKIAKIDVAILRLAVYELFFAKLEPAKVIIDEAIELAKEFGGTASPSFINGVLGTIFHEKSN